MSWLSADTIERLVDRCADSDTVRRAFRGVYPHNRLPMVPPLEKLRLPMTLIVNTDTHNLPGRHWISIYVDRQGRGEIFDSLVTPPSAHVLRFMGRVCQQRWVTNRLVYQPPYSSYCGVYVLLHILQRYKYNSLDTFCTAHFTSSLIDNDRLIRDYYRDFLLTRRK